MNENELKELKEQLKKELLAEINAKKENQNSWKKIKKEYAEEFRKFDYIDHWEYLNCEDKLITRDTPIHAEGPIANAIGTLLRIKYKVKSVRDVEANYEEVKDLVEKILSILKENTKEEENASTNG